MNVFEGITGDIVAIIPARGGSKGIPRKNIVDLGGKPLVAYSIETALAAGQIDRVIVSTDDEEIAEIARAWGAEVPFLRPKNIAGDRALINHAVTHVLDELKRRDEPVKSYVELYPTHPFRRLSMVNRLVSKGLEGVLTVKTMRKICVRKGGFATINSSGKLEPHHLLDISGMPVTTMFRPYGLLVMKSLLHEHCSKSLHVEQIADPIELIDIDTIEDLERARRVVEQQQFDFMS